MNFEQLANLVTSDSELDEEEKILLFRRRFGRSSSVVGGVGGAAGLTLGRLMLPFGLLVAFLKQPAIRGLGPL